MSKVKPESVEQLQPRSRDHISRLPRVRAQYTPLQQWAIVRLCKTRKET